MVLAALLVSDGRITGEEEISSWCLENEGVTEGELLELARKYVRGAEVAAAENTLLEAAAEATRAPLITPVKEPRARVAIQSTEKTGANSRAIV